MIAASGTAVRAQDAARSAGPRARSFSLTGSVLWVGGTALGSRAATLTPNQFGSVPRVTLFSTDSRLQPSIGYEARFGFNFNRILAAEAGVSRGQPLLRVTISADAEGAPAATLSGDRRAQYLIDGSLVAHLIGLAMGGRAIPFVLGGAGQLRQVYAASVLVETGPTLHAGGGVKYFARSRNAGFPRGLGVRADIRAYVRSRRLDLADKARATLTAGIGGFVAF